MSVELGKKLQALSAARTNAQATRPSSAAAAKSSTATALDAADARRPRTMSQVRRACPSDAELSKMIKDLFLTEPDFRFGMSVTMNTRNLCMERMEVTAVC
eukprot:COSAG01_NODE_19297_length_1018_cov_6.459195_2_plen_100_part_01